MKTNTDLLHESYLGESKKSAEERAALLVGKVINVILTIAGGTACVYGLVTWINHHNF